MRKSVIIVVLLILVFGTASVALAYPPAGTDEFQSSAVITLNLNIIGVEETVTVTGPTIVNRGPEHDPGDGKLEIPTEIVSMQLTGLSPSLGPIRVTESPWQNSLGRIKQKTAGVDYPAESFFDVFVEIEAGGNTFFNKEPLRVEAQIRKIPPYDDTYTHQNQVDIYNILDPNTAVGRIVSATHKVLRPVPEKYKKESMPDFGQHSSGWCWVAAWANSIWWYAHHGYPWLLDDPTTPGKPFVDDDGDGAIDEDRIDGVDNDTDTKIDEDPGDYKDIDPDSQGAGVDWGDANDGPPPRKGYRKLLRKIASAVTKKYSEGATVKDQLKGIQKFLDEQARLKHEKYGSVESRSDSHLKAHAYITPEYLVEPLHRLLETTVTEEFAAYTPPPIDPRLKIVEQVPTLHDYKIELSASQDVTLGIRYLAGPWAGAAHRVTGVSYDQTVVPKIIDISDPWTHKENSTHDDPDPGPSQDHNNSPTHKPDPGDVEPYDDWEVVWEVPFIIQEPLGKDYNQNGGQDVALVYSILAVSPVPQHPRRPVGLIRLRGVTDTIHITKLDFSYRDGTEIEVTEATSMTVKPGQTIVKRLPRGKYAWPDDVHIEYEKNATLKTRFIPDSNLGDSPGQVIPKYRYGLSPDDIEFEEESVPTGANTYLLGALALLAMITGLVVIRRGRRSFRAS